MSTNLNQYAAEYDEHKRKLLTLLADIDQQFPRAQLADVRPQLEKFCNGIPPSTEKECNEMSAEALRIKTVLTNVFMICKRSREWDRDAARIADELTRRLGDPQN